MNTLVKFPTRARPALFVRQLERYLADPTARVLVTADLDDESMYCDEMIRHLASRKRVTVRWGNNRNKVEACNDGIADEKWDLLILASDDMTPQRPDYAQRIADIFEEFFPEGDGVLHLNDGRVGRQLNTLPICDRKYFDRFGFIYHNVYSSLWCDNEWQEVSERLGRAIYVNECIIRHDWIGETNPHDKLHRHNESFNDQDARTFRARQRAGFPS